MMPFQPCIQQSLHAIAHLLQCSHAGGQNRGTIVGGDGAQIGRGQQFTRGNLEARHAQLGQKVDTLFIKRGGHELNAHLITMLLQLDKGCLRQRQLPQHGQLTLTLAQITGLIDRLWRLRLHQLLRHKGLKLDRISA